MKKSHRTHSARAPRPSRPAAVLVLFLSLPGLLLGVGIFAAGIGFARSYSALLREGAEAWATVQSKEVRQRVGRGGGESHVLLYTFTAEGAQVRGEEGVGERVFHATPHGARRRVLYEPGRPSNHYLKEELTLREWLLLPAFNLLCGGFIACLCAYAASLSVRGILARPIHPPAG